MPTRGEFSPLGRRGPQLREVTGVGRGITVDRHDGGRIRLTNNSCNVWPCFTTWHLTGSLLRPRLPLPQEQFAPREPASNPLSRMINHSSTLKATLFAPPNQQGVRDLCPLSQPLRRPVNDETLYYARSPRLFHFAGEAIFFNFNFFFDFLCYSR